MLYNYSYRYSDHNNNIKYINLIIKFIGIEPIQYCSLLPLLSNRLFTSLTLAPPKTTFDGGMCEGDSTAYF